MKFFKKFDLIVISALLLIGGAGLAFYYLRPSGTNLTAEVYYDSEIIATFNLDEAPEESFSLAGHKNITFHTDGEGGICFESSDCPDQICVHSGILNRHGDSAACLPNKLIVRIVSPKSGDADHIA